MDLKKLTLPELDALYSMCRNMALDEERHIRISNSGRTSKTLDTIVRALASVQVEIMNRIGKIAE